MSVPAVDKPTVLVLASTYPRWAGDPEPAFVHELARRLTHRFRVIVLCPHASGAPLAEVMDGVQVRRYRYAPAALETLVNDGGIVTNLKRARWKWLLVPGFVLAQAWQMWRLCRHERVDVVHAHWLIPQGLLAAAQNCLPGRAIPYVVTSHGADLYALRHPMLQALKRWVIARAQAVTVVSNAMKQLVASLPAHTGHVTVLPMGVDMRDRFQPADDARDADHLLFVGRLVEKKGLRYLLEALPAIRQRRQGVHLTIAGFGPDEAALRSLTEAMGLGGCVTYLGAVPQADLPPLYRRATLFVAPFVQAESGDQEGLPVALMEAVACGCPVVAGRVAGLEDMLGQDAASCTVDSRDVPALAQAVLSSLAYPAQAIDRARRMRRALLDRLDWGTISQRYGDILEQAARSTRTTGATVPK